MNRIAEREMTQKNLKQVFGLIREDFFTDNHIPCIEKIEITNDGIKMVYTEEFTKHLEEVDKYLRENYKGN